MKFLIQKINGEIRHDFTFALLESIRYNNWCRNPSVMKVKFLDYIEVQEPSDIYPIQFKPMHKDYVPVGSVEFVSEFLGHFYGLTPKPINVPEELSAPYYTHRPIINTNELNLPTGRWFVKSNDKIKGFAELIDLEENHVLPEGNYQVSHQITIESEWRAFVFRGKLIGLQNYCGEFTKFPSVNHIESMIKAYKSAPIAYTLDVGVTDYATFVVEIHDFFSCGLYGFMDSSLPHMFYQWFREYLQKNGKI